MCGINRNPTGTFEQTSAILSSAPELPVDVRLMKTAAVSQTSTVEQHEVGYTLASVCEARTLGGKKVLKGITVSFPTSPTKRSVLGRWHSQKDTSAIGGWLSAALEGREVS